MCVELLDRAEDPASQGYILCIAAGYRMKYEGAGEKSKGGGKKEKIASKTGLNPEHRYKLRKCLPACNLCTLGKETEKLRWLKILNAY